MIRDLAEATSNHEISADYLVIGAGISGLLLAAKLCDRGQQVVLLESGGREQKEETHPLNDIETLADEYRGATLGRFRCLGGTSTRWGGALIPLLSEDIGQRRHVGCDAWPLAPGELFSYLPEVERMLAVTHGPYDASWIHEKNQPLYDKSFLLRYAKWPSFERRNFANVFHGMLRKNARLETWINATASHFTVDMERGRILTVEARNATDRTLTVRPKRIVLCSGAIESTRQLLLLNRATEGQVFRDCTALGRYFNDHLSLPLAEIVSADAVQLNKLAGFRFMSRTMRSLRFELSPTTQVREKVPSAFGHIGFETSQRSGFDVLRDFLRKLQKQGQLDAAGLLDLAGELPYLAKVAAWRAARRQLYWPSPARYFLHAVVEQLPRFENRIVLSNKLDALGVPSAAIDWRVSEDDLAPFQTFRRCFESYWQRSGLCQLGQLVWQNATPSNSTTMDIYHPCSSTRMGYSQRDAVVSPNLKVFGLNNIWVASTSVFPSAASANPTLTLMLLTLRLADHLCKTESSS